MGKPASGAMSQIGPRSHRWWRRRARRNLTVHRNLAIAEVRVDVDRHRPRDRRRRSHGKATAVDGDLVTVAARGIPSHARREQSSSRDPHTPSRHPTRHAPTAFCPAPRRAEITRTSASEPANDRVAATACTPSSAMVSSPQTVSESSSDRQPSIPLAPRERAQSEPSALLSTRCIQARRPPERRRLRRRKQTSTQVQ